MEKKTTITNHEEMTDFGPMTTHRSTSTTITERVPNPDHPEPAGHLPYSGMNNVIEISSAFFQEKSADVDRSVESFKEVIDRIDDTQIRLLHNGIGLSGEAGELIDAIKKHVFYNKPLDVENVVEECGDMLWYMTRLLKTLGFSLEDAMLHNHVKLNQKRYKKGYSNQAAQERADKEPGQ